MKLFYLFIFIFTLTSCRTCYEEVWCVEKYPMEWKELKITDENDQKEMIIDFIDDCLDTNYSNGMSDKFRKWSLKKENIEFYLAV